jgi:hypothetical protein
MNSPPGINAIEPVSLGVPSRTLTSELAVKVYEAGYVVIGNENVDWGLIMIVESLDRKTFSGEENGEMVSLLIPTWHCWHSGRFVRCFFARVIFLTL